jgi:hypothetical protein
MARRYRQRRRERLEDVIFLFSFTLVTNGAGMSVAAWKGNGRKEGVFWESVRAILGSTLLCFALLCPVHTYSTWIERVSLCMVVGEKQGSNEWDGFDSLEIHV